MFKPHRGYCTHPDCKNPAGAMIVIKKGWCDRCNYQVKQDAKKAAGKPHGPYKYVREATGEKDVFHAVLDNLPDTITRCWVCGVRIAVVTHHNFAHVVPKKKGEWFRLNPENIKIMCYNFQGTGCHSKWDFEPESKLREDAKFDKAFELEEKLLEEYKRIETKQNCNYFNL